MSSTHQFETRKNDGLTWFFPLALNSFVSNYDLLRAVLCMAAPTRPNLVRGAVTVPLPSVPRELTHVAGNPQCLIRVSFVLARSERGRYICAVG